MPRKGVVPAHLRKYLFKKGHGRKSSGGASMGKARSYAKRGVSYLKGGGQISRIGMGLGALYGAKDAINLTMGQGFEAAPINGLYVFTGIDVPNKKFDVDRPIKTWIPIIGGAIVGKVAGRMAERLLAAIGIKGNIIPSLSG